VNGDSNAVIGAPKGMASWKLQHNVFEKQYRRYVGGERIYQDLGLQRL